MTALGRLSRLVSGILGHSGAMNSPNVHAARTDASTQIAPGPTATAQPFLLTEEQIRDRAALSRLVLDINSNGGTYHELNLTPDLHIEGDYDMRRYVDVYAISENLSGLKVLDVGTAAGYFALECARRGADVMAIDIWDSPPVRDIARYAARRVTYVKKSLYELDASFGQFDIVICGSVLLHLPDLLGAIRALRTVCRGCLCISTACTADSGQSDRPTCDFIALKGEDGDYYTYWLVSEAALRRMLLIGGFVRVANESHFTLTTNEGRHQFSTPHVVMTGFVH